jgi:osmotically-inducible protein OsmY
MKHFVLLFALLLSGCATVPDDITEQVLQHDRRTYDGIASDKDIATRIKADLNDDEVLHGCCRININVYDGAVLVTGEAADNNLKEKAISMIRIVPNVTMVHDHLNIGKPLSKANRAKDSEMSDKVRTALTQIESLPDFDPLFVKVTSNNRIVYLMGRLHREEGKVVINVVRLQPQVKKIVALFNYID